MIMYTFLEYCRTIGAPCIRYGAQIELTLLKKKNKIGRVNS